MWSECGHKMELVTNILVQLNHLSITLHSTIQGGIGTDTQDTFTKQEMKNKIYSKMLCKVLEDSLIIIFLTFDAGDVSSSPPS